MSPNDPEDHPPKVPPPRPPGVERDRLPRPPDDEPTADTTPSQFPQHWKSWLVAAVGVLALLIVLLSNSGGSSKSQVTVTVPAPAPAGATGTTTETVTEPKSPPPPPEGPKRVWENEATFEEDAGYNVDKYPVEKGGVTGFTVHSKKVETFGGGKLAAWNGHEKPSLADCVSALNAADEEPVRLETIGQWFCAETAPSEPNDPIFVARFRYDSGEPPPEGHIAESAYYKFFMIVYKPGSK
jgi:hypothetical protein